MTMNLIEKLLTKTKTILKY